MLRWLRLLALLHMVCTVAVAFNPIAPGIFKAILNTGSQVNIDRSNRRGISNQLPTKWSWDPVDPKSADVLELGSLSSSAMASTRAAEAGLIQNAVPLVPLEVAEDQAAASLQHGVVRVDGVLEPEAAARLKQQVLRLRKAASDPTTQRWATWLGASDNRYVPGSRIQFSNPVEDRLTRGRSDLLLPLEDMAISNAIRDAVEKLQPVLCRGAAGLPRNVYGVDDEEEDVAERSSMSPEDLELIECGALFAEPGCDHQALHADFRRNNVMITAGANALESEAKPDMPPRLVTFIYLQDTPTVEHGPTAFLPGTANSASHAQVLAHNGSIIEGALNNRVAQLATVRAGDAVVYDASVLHFGSANSVEGNDRVVLYFGVSRKGHSELCAGPCPEGWEPVPPIPFKDYC